MPVHHLTAQKVPAKQTVKDILRTTMRDALKDVVKEAVQEVKAESPSRSARRTIPRIASALGVGLALGYWFGHDQSATDPASVADTPAEATTDMEDRGDISAPPETEEAPTDADGSSRTFSRVVVGLGSIALLGYVIKENFGVLRTFANTATERTRRLAETTVGRTTEIAETAAEHTTETAETATETSEELANEAARTVTDPGDDDTDMDGEATENSNEDEPAAD